MPDQPDTTDQPDEPMTEEQRRAFAGIHLMRYFIECVNAHAEGREPCSPEDMPQPENTGQINDVVETATAILTGHPGDRYEARTMLNFAALADMLAARGAELEGILHEIIHQEPRRAMIIRMRAAP